MTDIVKIQMQIEGELEVAKLTAAVNQQRQALAAHMQQLQATGATVAQVRAQTAQAAAQLAATTNQLAAAQANLANVTGNFGKKATYIVSGIAQAAQDAQYGLKNIENNILAITSSMGPYGVAIGIAATASIELYTHWDEVSKLWGKGHTKTEAERMEDLAKATHKTADEMKALSQFKRKEAIVAGAEAPKAAETDLARKVEEVLREEGPGSRIAEKLATFEAGGSLDDDAMKAAKNTDEKESEDLWKSMTWMDFLPGGAKRRADKIKDVRARTRARLLADAQDLLASAGTDPDAVDAIAKRLEAAGMGDIAGKLRRAVKQSVHDSERKKFEEDNATDLGNEERYWESVQGRRDQERAEGAAKAAEYLKASPGRNPDMNMKWTQAHSLLMKHFNMTSEEAAKYAGGFQTYMMTRGKEAVDKAIQEGRQTGSTSNEFLEAEADREALAQDKAIRPGHDMAGSNLLLGRAAFGRALTPEQETAIRLGYGPANPRRMKNVKPEEQLRRFLGIGPGMSLDESQKKLEEDEFARLKSLKVSDAEARKQAHEFARGQRGDLEKRAFDTLRDPSKWEMPRGIGQSSSEAYIDAAGTAREGVDQQMISLMEKQLEAQIVLAEFAKKNPTQMRP